MPGFQYRGNTLHIHIGEFSLLSGKHICRIARRRAAHKLQGDVFEHRVCAIGFGHAHKPVHGKVAVHAICPAGEIDIRREFIVFCIVADILPIVIRGDELIERLFHLGLNLALERLALLGFARDARDGIGIVVAGGLDIHLLNSGVLILDNRAHIDALQVFHIGAGDLYPARCSI